LFIVIDVHLMIIN